MWKNRLIALGWVTLGSLTCALLIVAMKEKDHKLCSSIQINIHSTSQNYFVSREDVIDILKSGGNPVGREISRFNLRMNEADLEKNKWIQKAELFFDNNQVLQVKILERDPLARVFTVSGASFYLDSTGLRLPCNELQTARVPVFTSFPSDNKILTANDSEVLEDIKHLAIFIQTDSFWSAMISQISINQDHTYDLVPVLGDQTILFGSADSIKERFNRLYTFYKEIWTKVGFEKYEKIDLRFDGQVVAILRGTSKPAMDTSKAMQVLSQSPIDLKEALNDSSYTSDLTVSKQNDQDLKIKSKVTVNSAGVGKLQKVQKDKQMEGMKSFRKPKALLPAKN